MASLENINRILFTDLKPVEFTATEHQLLNWINAIEKTALTYQAKFDIAFPKPLNSKRKYFCLLITNDIIAYMNYMNSEFVEAETQPEKLYLTNIDFSKKINAGLTDVAKQIDEKNLQYTNIKRDDAAFILQYLKHELIRLYFEWQEICKEFVKEELSVQELQEKYFQEDFLDLIVSAETNEKIAPLPIANDSSFEPQRFDFRPLKKGVLSFTTMIANPSRFASFEQDLFNNKLIDENYNFIDEHGNKQILAAAYHQLFNKNHFNKMNFESKKSKPLTDLEVRKFLNHRYNVNLDKTFRQIKNKPNALSGLIESHHFLDHLPNA